MSGVVKSLYATISVCLRRMFNHSLPKSRATVTSKRSNVDLAFVNIQSTQTLRLCFDFSFFPVFAECGREQTKLPRLQLFQNESNGSTLHQDPVDLTSDSVVFSIASFLSQLTLYFGMCILAGRGAPERVRQRLHPEGPHADHIRPSKP